jgi:MFS family permease
MALFFSAATLAGAFGGLLARGISQMDGVGGKAGWSWIFIIEGLLTLIVGAFGYWFIHNYPDTWVFFSYFRVKLMSLQCNLSHRTRARRSPTPSRN